MDYNETICKSVEIIVNGLIDKIPYDKTIEGIIINEKPLDEINSEYAINFNNAYFTAIGSRGIYKSQDNVYILIPQGNFDLQKIILTKKYNE